MQRDDDQTHNPSEKTIERSTHNHRYDRKHSHNEDLDHKHHDQTQTQDHSRPVLRFNHNPDHKDHNHEGMQTVDDQTEDHRAQHPQPRAQPQA